MAYQFDDRNISFRKVTTSFAKWLRRFLWWLLGSFTLSAAAYVLLSFFISTDREKELIKENRLYEQLYGQMLERQQLIQDVTDGLQARDHEIYDQIFHTKAPSLDPIESVDLALFSDTTSEESKVSITTRRLADLSAGAAMVEDNFREIFALLAERGVGNVPMQAPLPGVTYAQAGASVGQKTSPFYKIVTRHDGLDLMASEGTPVLASADGVVESVQRSRTGLGNVVTMDHGNGYVTRYAHLSDILVPKGRRVTRGTVIGRVGISGNSLAPHLHYEVLRDGEAVDPVDHMFATLSPQDYANFAFMTSRTGQSLD